MSMTFEDFYNRFEYSKRSGVINKKLMSETWDYQQKKIDNALNMRGQQILSDYESKIDELEYYRTQWRKIGGAANLKELVNKAEKLNKAIEMLVNEHGDCKECVLAKLEGYTICGDCDAME